MKKMMKREVRDGVTYAIREIRIRVAFSVPDGLHASRLCTENNDNELASYLESYINMNIEGISEDYEEDYPQLTPPVSKSIN